MWVGGCGCGCRGEGRCQHAPSPYDENLISYPLSFDFTCYMSHIYRDTVDAIIISNSYDLYIIILFT